MAVGDFVPLRTQCEAGFGIAACPTLGLAVASVAMDNILVVFRAFGGCGGGGVLSPVYTLGG